MHVVLRHNKYLTLYNKGRISDRLMAISDGHMILCYNRFKNTFELHDSRSILLDGDRNSLQATFFDGQQLNGYLIKEIKATEYRRFILEVQDEKEYLTHIHDKNDEQRLNDYLDTSMKTIEDYLGRKI